MKLVDGKITAFYEQDGILVKAYYQGRDWQVLTNTGSERWFTAWSSELKRSLVHAIQSVVEQEVKATFDVDNLVIV